KAGFDWFYFLKENHFGGCLADDMGLGKTIQTLALLQKEKELFLQTREQNQAVLPLPSPAVNTSAAQLELFEQQSASAPHLVKDTEASFQHESQVLSDSLKTYIRTSLIVVPNSLVYNWYHE